MKGKTFKLGTQTYMLTERNTTYILIKGKWIQTVTDKQIIEAAKNGL